LKKWLKWSLFFAFVLGWIILLYFYPAKELVDILGVNNSYLAVFILAVIAGGSSFTAGPFYVVLSSFAQAGLSIPLLAALAGLGAMAGDTFYFFFGKQSGQVFSGWLKKIFERFNRLLQKYPKLTPLFIFIYAGFFPAPNDPVTISLGMSDYPYKKVFLPLLLGNALFFVLFLYGVHEIILSLFS
jgi:membrane protein YqaA with SNARE-associated domain